MLLNNILNSKNNNFDLLRLIAALMVIYGHGPALMPNAANKDIVSALLHFDYSGSLAVKFFFMLSGLLVTASLMSKPFIVDFLIKRIARIFPGLLLCSFVTVFIVGPLFTKLPLIEYFSQKQPWSYFINNSSLYELQWTLPGVFSDSKYGVNGSLWTLPFEFKCYLFLAALYGIGMWRFPWSANIISLAVIFISYFAPHFLPPQFASDPEAARLPACFAVGALFATNQRLISINISGLLALGLLTMLLWYSDVKTLVFYVFFFYACLYVSSTRFVVDKLKIPADPSYGVYIYGFLIQQCVAHLFPGESVLFNQLFSAIVAVILGLASWHFIEKPSVVFVKKSLAKENAMVAFGESVRVFSGKIFNGIVGKNALIFIALMIIAWIVHFLALRFVFPGHYAPLSFHHSDFYIPGAFAYAPGDYYSFQKLLGWPRPLFMWFYKFSGYFGHRGSIALLVIIVFLNCTLIALFAKKLLGLKINASFFLFFALYCFLLFTQPYFYTFYSQDIGSQLSFLLLLVGCILYTSLVDKYKVVAFLSMLVCAASAFLVKETYALSFGFLAFCWFIYYVKRDFSRAILPGAAILLAGILSVLISVTTKSIFVNLNAEKGSDYHIDLNILSIFKEMFLYAEQAITLLMVLVLALIAVQIYKFYKSKFMVLCFFACVAFAALAWLPNALLPFHHFEGYSFNGLYVCFALIFFVLKMIQDETHSKKILYATAFLALISPLSSMAKYKDSRNTWVLSMEKIQTNMLASFKRATSQLPAMPQGSTILITGITSPFHPFAFPESIRSFPGGVNANYYFVVPKEFPANVGSTRDLVHFIAEPDVGMMTYDQEWKFDDNANLQIIDMKK